MKKNIRNVKKYFRKTIKIFLLLYAVYFASFFLVHKAQPNVELNKVLIKEFKEYLEKDGWFERNKQIKCHVVEFKDEYSYSIYGCLDNTTSSFKMPVLKTLSNFLGLDFYAISIPEVLDDKTDIKIKLKEFLASRTDNYTILFKTECSLTIGLFLKCPGQSHLCSINNYSISIF